MMGDWRDGMVFVDNLLANFPPTTDPVMSHFFIISVLPPPPPSPTRYRHACVAPCLAVVALCVHLVAMHEVFFLS